MRRLFFILAASVFLAGNIAAQVSTSAAVNFAIRDAITKESGDPVANLYQDFEPDTVIQYSVSIGITDSSATNTTFDVTLNWKGRRYTKSGLSFRTDAEYWFPTADWNTDIPDSLFAITWDKPGVGDHYSYQSFPLEGMKFDRTTLAGIVIDVAHYEIHDGDTYEVGFDTTFSVNDTMFYGIILPNDDNFEMHVQFEVSTSGGAWYNVIKNDTIAGGADTVSIANVHDGSSNTSELNIYRYAVVSETGSEGWGTLLGAGQNNGGTGRTMGEYIWCGGTHKHHAFRFVSLANSNRVTIRARWYEIHGR